MNKFRVTDFHILLKWVRNTLHDIYSNYLQAGLHNLHSLFSVKKRKPHIVQLLDCDVTEKKKCIE